jgi:hypothetical protein
VLEANRGGVVVDVGLRGFRPLSQLVSIGVIDTREHGVPESLKSLIGKRLMVRVLEADPRRDRLILSEKAATQKLRSRPKGTRRRGSSRKAPCLSGTVVGCDVVRSVHRCRGPPTASCIARRSRGKGCRSDLAPSARRGRDSRRLSGRPRAPAHLPVDESARWQTLGSATWTNLRLVRPWLPPSRASCRMGPSRALRRV